MLFLRATPSVYCCEAAAEFGSNYACDAAFSFFLLPGAATTPAASA